MAGNEDGSKKKKKKETEESKVKMTNKRDFKFVQAYDQIKDLDPSILRPKQPKGEPHLAFIIKFAGEDVEGDGGPYRQFFTDLTSELTTVR